MIKLIYKQAQISTTLTWFIGFLIIFFVMLMFIFFTLLATASREIDVKPMDGSSKDSEVQRNLIVFLNGPIEIDKKEKKTLEWIKDSLDPYFDLLDRNGGEMSLMEWAFKTYISPDSLEKIKKNEAFSLFDENEVNEITRKDLEFGKQLSKELDNFCNKYYLQIPQGVVKPGGLSTKEALGHEIFYKEDMLETWTPTIELDFLYKGRVFEIKYRQLRECEDEDEK